MSLTRAGSTEVKAGGLERVVTGTLCCRRKSASLPEPPHGFICCKHNRLHSYNDAGGRARYCGAPTFPSP